MIIEDIATNIGSVTQTILNGKLFTLGNTTYAAYGGKKYTYLNLLDSSANFTSLHAHSDIIFALTSNNWLWGFGNNAYGQLGLGDTTYRSSPVQVGALSDWSKVSPAKFSTIAIKTNGTLWSWGNNTNGQLGQSNNISRSSPTQVGALSDWSKVACGYYTTQAIKTDGTLWGWGGNNYGHLGLGDTIIRSSPVQVGALSDWSKVACGSYHTIAIKTDGTLWSCGYNNTGQLGHGNRIHRSSPIQVGSLSDWNIIGCSTSSSYFYNNSDVLYACGTTNNPGQTNVQRSLPTQLGSFKSALRPMLDIKSNTTQIVPMFILNNIGENKKTLTSWNGYLGDGNSSTNTQIYIEENMSWRDATRFSSSDIVTIDSSGRLWKTNLWTQTDVSSPVQLGSLSNWEKLGKTNQELISTKDVSYVSNNLGELYYFGKNIDYADKSTASYFTEPFHIDPDGNERTSYRFIIKNDNTLWGCGYNDSNYTLSIIDAAHRSSPTQVGSLSDWMKIDESFSSVFSVKTDGTLWTWGDNFYGQLGLGDTIHRSSPVQVGNSLNWIKISGGFAINTDRTLWSLGGENSQGQLGLGDTISRSSPTQVGSLNDWHHISSNSLQTFAVSIKGTLWTWGYNFIGVLGVGDTIHRSSPTQVGSLSDWLHCKIYSDDSSISTLILKYNGTLWLWGGNGYGNLGLGDTIHRSSPTQVGSLSDWCTISSSSAVKTNGTLWTWGFNTYGGLGLGDTIHRSSPTQVGSLSDWKEILSFDKICKQNGTLWVCGYNGTGQLGLGDTIHRSSPTQVGTLNNWNFPKVKEIQIFGDDNITIREDNSVFFTGSDFHTTFSEEVPLTTQKRFYEIDDNVITCQGITYTKSDNSMYICPSYGFNFVGYFFPYYDRNYKISNTLKWKKMIHRSGNCSVAIDSDDKIYQSGVQSSGLATPTGSYTKIGNDTWSDVGITNDYSVISAVKTNGTLWSWGLGIYGCLGLGDTISRSSPVQVGTLSDWSKVVGSRRSFAFLKTNGTLWTCGYNLTGCLGLGLGDTASRSSPTQVGTLSDWSKISTKGEYDFAFYNASNTYVTGELKTYFGVSGIGTLSPVGLYSDIDGNLALKPNGELYYLNDVSPIRIGSSSNWVKISDGLAVNSDKKVFSYTTYSKKAKNKKWNKQAKSISVGGLDTPFLCTVTTDSTLWSWGYNQYGTLGVGDQVHRSSPTQVGTLSDWSKVACGTQHAAALKTDGTLWAWGYNSYGQLSSTGLSSNSTAASPAQMGSLSIWQNVWCMDAAIIGEVIK